MDYFTFLDSSAALAGYFQELAQAGYTFDAEDMTQTLPRIREIGLKMETAMFQATGGVNTQKGLIFLLGLSLFATSYLLARDGSFTVRKCRDVIRAICRNLVQKELHTSCENEPTHGISCFRQYGTEYGGVRQEAQEGLPSVFEHGLLELNTQLSGQEDRTNAAVLNNALIQTLLRLMTVVNDTNILYRKDLGTLNTIKQMAQHVLDAGTQDERSRRYVQLINYCQQKQVSPGGSADLLAVTIFFSFVQQRFLA
jgi:triphosphoribosyl-dephospho-CoA synthetase